MDSTSDNKNVADQQLVFIHIPKTAGLSLHSVLEKIFGEADTLRVGNDDDLREFRRRAPTQLIGSRYISGHFFYEDIKSRVRPDAQFISVLRDPIARILSNYNYVSNWSQHPLHERMSRQSFAQHVDENRNFLRGLCCRQLTGSRDAEKAIKILQSRYTLVGTTGNIPAFLAGVGRLIGKEVPEERANRSGGQGPNIDLSSDLCDVLLEITKEDRLLYDFVRSLPNGLLDRTGP
jgi:hypothetical protein